MNNRNLMRGLVVALFAWQLGVCAWADAGAETRAAFLAMVEKPRVALAPELTALEPVEELRRFHLRYSSAAEQRVPGFVLLPDSSKFPGRRPAVIVLHGTGGNKEQMLNVATRSARVGFIAVAIDAPYHGERTAAGSGAGEYNAAIARAFSTGKGRPFYYETTWDVMRLIDYLETRADVDAKRIGLIGFSKGGIETYLTAAVDTRVAVAVPFIGVQSFKWALENGQWPARIATIQDAFDAAAAEAGKAPRSVDFVRQFYARVVPGIDGQFDGPAMLTLIAPRALLVVNSDSDANTPIAGVRLAVETARPAFAALNAAQKLELRVQENTAHRVTPESLDAAIAWFLRWL